MLLIHQTTLHELNQDSKISEELVGSLQCLAMVQVKTNNFLCYFVSLFLVTLLYRLVLSAHTQIDVLQVINIMY